MPYGMSSMPYRGDPFLGGLIKSGFKFLKGGVKSLVGGQQTYPGGAIKYNGGGQQPVPGLRGMAQRLLPGGASGYETDAQRKRRLAKEEGRSIRRRINPANPKALRRAIRRQDGFVKLARRALKGSGYTIVTKGSRRPKRDLGVGHTHVR